MTMTSYSFAKKTWLSASVLFFALSVLPVSSLHAADLQVLAGGAMTAPMKEIAAQFESASGNKIIYRFGTTPELIKLVTTGGPFDVAIVPREVFMDAAAKAKFWPGPTTDIARVGLGVAVRAGALKPDISTPGALKQALLNAKSIATIPASAAGAQVLGVFDVLGVGDAVKAKIKPQGAPAQLVQTVANGDAELGVFLINVLTAPGLDVVGPFPAEVQKEVVFTGSIAADTKEAEAANAFLSYLRSPAATAVIKSRGMTPG
jgi:molybdate transport system substrate-binding protein